MNKDYKLKEWASTDVVFDALAQDGDGQISPEELAAGVVAALSLAK